MSFRTRLTSFFVVIVVVPMVAVGFLVFRLIGDSASGKADARASGLATAAASIYSSERAVASVGAQTIARDAPSLLGPGLASRLSSLATQAGLTRVRVISGGRVLADVGSRTAVAPALATLRPSGHRHEIRVEAAALTAAEYTRELSAPGVAVVVIQRGRILSSPLALGPRLTLPRQGTVTLAGVQYRAVGQTLVGFNRSPVTVTVLSNVAATATSVGASRALAAAFIAGFLILALSFSLLASRALQGQLNRFLHAARRLAGGDFSSPIPTEGEDEFAELGVEFNNMSNQLERRLHELSQERLRLREAIHRIGHTFASNLDRSALLEVALQTALDAVQGDCGRLSLRSTPEEPLEETFRVGSLGGREQQVYDAERRALTTRELAESASAEVSVASIALGPVAPGARAYGLITVGRPGGEFTDDDRELLRSLASQATLALENVELHLQVSREAVTDGLTGLANHGRFQELLSAEIEQVRRYQHPVGLIMLDVDNFKSVNDTYGHQQGDVVLRHVARVLRETSREADAPARYGGEELALILPHTDLEGSFAIAERLRASIERLRIPRLDQQGTLRITASIGVAASSDGEKDALIADADTALYKAKRGGKNRTVRADAKTANVFGGE